jgi:hypothetical protein
MVRGAAVSLLPPRVKPPAAPGEVEVLSVTPPQRQRKSVAGTAMEAVSPTGAALLSPGGGAATEDITFFEPNPPRRPPPLLRQNTAFHAVADFPGRKKGLLESMPVGTNGIALGLCGLSGILREYKYESMVWDNFFYIVMGAAATLFVLFTARCFVSTRAALAEELNNPRLLFAYGAYQMTYLFILQRLVNLVLPHVVKPGIYVGAAAQAVLIVAFFVACFRRRCYPEPLWNPPTVNCAVTSIARARRPSRRSSPEERTRARRSACSTSARGTGS